MRTSMLVIIRFLENPDFVFYMLMSYPGFRYLDKALLWCLETWICYVEYTDTKQNNVACKHHILVSEHSFFVGIEQSG